MQTDHIVSLIDHEIAQLQRARSALVGLGNVPQVSAKGPDRPKGSTDKTAEATASTPKRATKPAQRTMSAEGRARIAAAQKARWAAQKQAKEPATRKYAVKPKGSKKTAAKTKRTAPPEGQPAVETTTADA